MCGAVIKMRRDQAARSTYWCPQCQPEPRSARDARLGEVSRRWSDDLDRPIDRYFGGEAVPGGDAQADAAACVHAVVEEHGRAIYVTHGTILSLYLASVVPSIDAGQFWTDLTNPDAREFADAPLSPLTPRA